jgi:type II secretory pathway pseudopilin PulG
MKTLMQLFALLFLTARLLATEKPAPPPPPAAEIVFRELRYDAKVSEDEARFTVAISAEATGKGEAVATLFDGELALLPPKLPTGLRVEREGNVYRLFVTRAGKHQFKLEVVAKITRTEPWNHVSFKGPQAAIASVNAQASGADVDLQLLTGTVVESIQTNNLARVWGGLGAESQLSLRWQSRAAEVARKPVVAAESTITVQITPTVIKFTSQFRYDVIQGKLPKLTIALPATHALTRLVGEQIRDWSVATEGEKQILTVEFIKAIEKSYQLTVLSEQTVETTPATLSLAPPQPLDAERESGAFTVSAEDMQAEIDSASGLRQVNAPAGALAAYRFSARPLALALRLKRIEPVVTVSDRATVRLEETRLLANHTLNLNVDKAGIYQLELQLQAGFVVAEVRGEGVEDWKMADRKLRVSFANRVLGARRLEVQLEQALKQFPERFVIEPLRVVGATKETAQVGAASAAGIQLKTAELVSLREIPVNRLPARTDELLAYTADGAEWKLSLSAERLSARVVAEIFNLVTIGDGLVGGSATIRYGLINQGVQEFRVKVPAHWKNVEFTGPNIRRKEQLSREAGETSDTNAVVWTIGLQDKAWSGYTLVVTYDYQFDPQGALLPVAGVHALEVERETGSIAITTAASLKLNAKPASEPLRRVDEAELAGADRSLITRSVLLAYQYTGDQYDLAVEVKRYEESKVLSAVADRTQLTSVLTEAGELLTQASFMVKNNDKQFQRFLLPAKANFWSCYVNGQPAKPERDQDWLLVPLPRGANRDQAFAVDIVYAEQKAALQKGSQALQLHAPQTDVPNTYAEWQLYAPTSKRLSSFGGSMNVAQGTDYAVLDAWKQFLAFYGKVLREVGPGLIIFGLLAFLVVALVVVAVRRGLNGLLTTLAVIGIMAILGAMLLPALSKAKSKAQRISSANNLKQIGLAARIFAGDNGERLPVSFEEMMNELNTDKITYDPETGGRYTYLGAGHSLDEITPDSVIAYSPIIRGQCNVLLADGSVQMINAGKFAEYSQRGFIQRIAPEQVARQKQERAVMAAQFENAPATAQPAPVPVADAVRRFDDGSGVAGVVTGMAPGGQAGAALGFIPAAVMPPAKAAGLRSIRIEIPRTGNAFLFTKVLNVRDEPLSVSARIMSLHTFQQRQMVAQAGAFVVGLLVWLWQWRGKRNSFLLTLALVLMFGSVSSLLIAWRALHDALIVGFPIVVLAIISWLIWKFWPRQASPEVETDEPVESGATEIPPAVAGLVIAFLLALPLTSAAADPVTANVSILSASYTGSVNDRVAQLEATIQVNAAKAGQKIALFGEDVAVQSFTAKPREAQIIREGKTVWVLLPRKGAATLQLKLLVRLGGDVAKRQLTFAIPAALTSRLALTIDQPDADVEFPGAISFQRAPQQQLTSVTALIGAGERVQLAWTPRVKRAAEVAATVMCQNAALVSFGGGVMSVRAGLDYQVTQGELRAARVKLPAGQRLLRVEGESIRTWTTKEEGGETILLVELLKGMTPNYRLTVETEKSLEALPATARIEIPHALDMKRETGLVALRADDELEFTVARTDELQRVDSATFIAAAGPGGAGVTSAFRFLKSEFTLEVRVAALQSQVEATVRNHIRVGDEQLNLSATIDYTIKRVGVFALKLAVPEGFRIESVTGTNVLQWNERNDAGERGLEVTLKERTAGAYALRVELGQALKSLPKTLLLAGVQPLGTQKLSGFVSVSAEPGVAVKTAAFDGLTEIPVGLLPGGNALAGESGLLAFKFIAAETGRAAPWKVAVTTETVEPWVRAEVASTLTVSDTLVNGRTLVRFDIQNAPVKELHLKIPAALRNVEITGANIRRRDHTGEVWRVELQNKVRGVYTLTVTWDQARGTQSNLLALAGLSVEGVERETGTLAVAAKTPLQVTEGKAAELLKLDTHEWPEWAGLPDTNAALAYRYLRPGYELSVEAKRYSEAEVLQALAESFHLTTVVAEDGQMMTTLSVAVRNNGRQHLEIALPAGTTVWSAFVAGQAVRPSLREGKLLLPLENAGSDDAALAVELTYVSTNQNQFPSGQGRVNLVSPTLDVPLKNARWELYLPPDYRYDEFTGTMSREAGVVAVDATMAQIPELQESSYSVLEYTKRESDAKAEAWKDMKSEIFNAKKKLAEGNVKEAANYYYRVQSRSSNNDRDLEAKEVEQQLRRAQASNIVQAQQDFSLRNNSAANLGVSFGGSIGGAQEGVLNGAAEQQWEKLQQAQEVAVAKVRPLRVNLPTRGLRHAFAQVLQTETGKPMTVSFMAENAQRVSWPRRITMGLVGFMALWVVVAFVAARVAPREAVA